MLESISQLSTIQLATLIVLLSAIVVQLIYTAVFYVRLAISKPKPLPASLTSVSVVICARNESENLMNNIPLIMEQEFPKFEVIVVNDCSWDDSDEILKALSVKYANLKVLKVDEQIHRMGGKKFGLTLGIKSAQNDYVLLTDADCKPLSRQWMSEMTSSIREQKIIGLGVSLLQRQKGFWKNLFRFESIHTAANYISFAMAKSPYMGVGRNLIYEREKFFEVGGFRKHMHIQGGEDDLFINEVSTGKNTSVIISNNSQTTSESPESLGKWFTQKRRHLFPSGQYKLKHKVLLALEPMTWWVMWGAAIVLFILQTNILLVITPILIRYAFVYGTFIAIGRKWKAVDSVWALPVWEAFLNIVKPIVLLSNLISKPKQWMKLKISQIKVNMTMH